MSAMWEPRRLYEALRQKRVDPLYLFHGEEIFLMSEALALLTETALEDGLRDFNLDVFYGGDDDASRIRDAIETLPMMAARRVIVVKEAQDLKAKDLEQLLPVIEQPVDMTTAIFLFSKIDQRLKFTKIFKEKGIFVEFKRPGEHQIPEWVLAIAKRYRKQITPGAASLVHQLVGTNLMDIDQELQKLSQYVGDRDEVDVEDVKTLVSPHRTESVFALADAIGSNDRAQALECLAHLIDQGENPVGIVALVARHFRILNTLRMGQENGLSQSQLSSRAGVPPYFIQKYLSQSRQWDRGRLENAQQALLVTDRALKSSPVSPHIWLENFIIKTCL